MTRDSSRDTQHYFTDDDVRNHLGSFHETKDLLIQGTVHPVTGGSALFAIGYQLDLRGRREDAEQIYRQTIDLLESMSSGQNSKLGVSDLLNLAYAHGKSLYSLGRYHAALVSFRRALDLFDSLILLDASRDLIEYLGKTLNWFARAQRRSGRFADASLSYERALDLWQYLIDLPPSEVSTAKYQHYFATAMYGYAKCLRQRGRRRESRKFFKEAGKLLRISVSLDSVI